MKIDDNDTMDDVSTVDSMLDPFMESDELTFISTGITASVITERDLFSAHAKGESELENYSVSYMYVDK